MNNNKKPLNVLQFICPTGFYGAERWILALCKHLDLSDVKSELVVTLETNTHDLKLVKEFSALGLPTHQLPMSGRFDLSAVKKLAALIKEREIDVIHTHGYKSDIIGVWAAKKAGIPCVVTPHGFENAADLKLRTFIWLGCQAMKYADVVAPLSKQLVEDVKGFSIPNNRIQYIQNGVDLSEVEAVAKLPKDNQTDQKTIGFIGQMISRKNIRDILDIFDLLQSRHNNLRLVLLGDGDSRPELETYAKTLVNHQNIEFLGFRDDRLELLKTFDLFVMTSTLEGIPRCLMEAMAMGTPVAAYNIAGIDQLLAHEKTGLLATLGDKETLAEYWEKLLFDASFSEAISANAKAFVYEKYSAQRMASEYLELFQRLVKH